MSLSDDQWAVAQSWIGTAEPRLTFEARFDRLETLDLAIEEALRSLITSTASQPGSVSLPSGLSVSVGENLRTWKDVLAMFYKQGGTDGVSDGKGSKVYQRRRPELR